MLSIIKKRYQSGATIVEVLVAIALTGIILPTLATALVAAHAGKATSVRQLQAESLLREATEAVRSVREKGWSNVATDGTYHPVISAGAWSLSSGSETINGFTRSVVISTPQRDSNDTIVTSGGTDDPSTKHVVVTVSWTKPTDSSISSETYLTRWQNNTAWTQTTQADFNAGTFNNTQATAGGTVRIAGAGTGYSWATPRQVGSYNISGNTDANDIYVDVAANKAYVVNGAGLSIINVSDPTAPTLAGTYNAGVQVNGVYVSGNYAYLASTNNSAELTVVNISNPAAPTLAGSLNLGDTADANCVYIVGSYAYVGKVLSNTGGINEFYVVNISNPAAPTLAGSLNLTGNVNSIVVVGSYAYLATSVTTAELTVVNISNPAAPTVAGSYNSAGTAAANDVYYGGYYLYLAEATNSGGPELFILDISSPASPVLTGSYELNGTIYGVAAIPPEVFLVTSRNGYQFTALDASDPTNPVLDGRASITAGNAVYAANDTAYVADTSNSAELTIMQGALDTTGRAASGTYESPTFDIGHAVGFDYFAFDITPVTNTDVSIQIAVNDDNSTWNYVGPDGTPFSQYTVSGTIPLIYAQGRYFRYKVSMDTTNINRYNPELDDVTMTYSP